MRLSELVSVAESTDPGRGFELRYVVVDGSGPVLFGRDWLGVVPLQWNHIMMTKVRFANRKLQSVLQEYENFQA